jgi:hypothetical protein
MYDDRRAAGAARQAAAAAGPAIGRSHVAIPERQSGEVIRARANRRALREARPPDLTFTLARTFEATHALH